MKIKSIAAALFLSCLLVLSTGCGGTAPVAQDPGSNPPTNLATAETGLSPADDDIEVGEPPLEATASPSEVVNFFLDSLRKGDRQSVAATLTKKARIETAREGLVVQPIGTPAAKYKVGSVEYVGRAKDGAHVQSIWTEVDEEGASITYDVIWVLRKQETGWRIAGMATQISENETPEFLNFENPREMLEKIEEGASAAETANRGAGAGSPGTR